MNFYSRLIGKTPKFDFIRLRFVAFAISTVLVLGSVASMGIKGFNFGIDFAGGLLIETQTQEKADVSRMRSALEGVSLGEISLQEFGETGRDVMIRVQRQPGDERAQMEALAKVKSALGTGYDYRRVEIVGPKVGDELKVDGALAVALAVLAIAIYVWFRFEWQYGVGALIAIFHDVITTFGLYSITGMEFNLTAVAAILTIAGYSINDTVVMYDRVRENLRKYKSMPLYDLLNLSVNQTLARTILTVATVFITVVSLLTVGGDVLRTFSIAMLWGLVVGTFSSVYVGMPILIYFNLRTGKEKDETEEAEQATP